MSRKRQKRQQFEESRDALAEKIAERRKRKKRDQQRRAERELRKQYTAPASGSRTPLGDSATLVLSRRSLKAQVEAADWLGVSSRVEVRISG